jgi:antitoxin component YwqK of YwqJK toxin-antitoxin module
MKKLEISLIVLLFFGKIYSSPIDTIYFDKNWKITNPNNYKYYRTYEVVDSVINIMDHFNNGNIQMMGSCKTTVDKLYNTVVENPTGQFTYFDRKGRTRHIAIYDIPNNKNLISKVYHYELNLNTLWYSNIEFHINYFKNGNISSKGFIVDSCYNHLYWTYYAKDGRIKYQYEFDFGSIIKAIYYYKGYRTHIYNYKDQKKHGAFMIFYQNNGPIRMSGNYKYGKKHGEFIYYYKNGEIEKIDEYDGGKKIR